MNEREYLFYTNPMNSISKVVISKPWSISMQSLRFEGPGFFSYQLDKLNDEW